MTSVCPVTNGRLFDLNHSRRIFHATQQVRLMVDAKYIVVQANDAKRQLSLTSLNRMVLSAGNCKSAIGIYKIYGARVNACIRSDLRTSRWHCSDVTKEYARRNQRLNVVSRSTPVIHQLYFHIDRLIGKKVELGDTQPDVRSMLKLLTSSVVKVPEYGSGQGDECNESANPIPTYVRENYQPPNHRTREERRKKAAPRTQPLLPLRKRTPKLHHHALPISTVKLWRDSVGNDARCL